MYKHVVARYFALKLPQVEEKKYLRVDYAMLWWTPFLHSEKFYQTWILKRPSVIISTIYILMKFLTFSCTLICLIRHRVYILIMRKIYNIRWLWYRTLLEFAEKEQNVHICLIIVCISALGISFFFKYMINCK